MKRSENCLIAAIFVQFWICSACFAEPPKRQSEIERLAESVSEAAFDHQAKFSVGQHRFDGPTRVLELAVISKIVIASDTRFIHNMKSLESLKEYAFLVDNEHILLWLPAIASSRGRPPRRLIHFVSNDQVCFLCLKQMDDVGKTACEYLGLNEQHHEIFSNLINDNQANPIAKVKEKSAN